MIWGVKATGFLQGLDVIGIEGREIRGDGQFELEVSERDWKAKSN